ncbi:Mu transposase domain-containing protein, partial [Spirochaeta dissipatitropha]
LRPLPAARWKCVSWTRAKVQESWRIQVDRAWYSVPYTYIGTTMLVYLTSDTVEIYHDYQLITTHPRAQRPWQRMIKPEHDPPNVDAFTRST